MSDLLWAVEYNPAEGVTLDELEGCEVRLEIEGENDGASWHWIVRLTTGEWMYITGGCDYTGWDCQSSIDVHRGAPSLEEALKFCGDDERRIFEEMLANGEKVR